jgi:hypothetical protein
MRVCVYVCIVSILVLTLSCVFVLPIAEHMAGIGILDRY